MKKLFIPFFLISVLLFSCNNGNEKINVSSLKFDVQSVTIKKGQQRALSVSYNPKNADFDSSKLKYECIPSDLFKIVSSDQSGCVIEAVKGGDGVVQVSYENISSYCQVEVTKDLYSGNPYITLPSSDLTLEMGTKRTIVANLNGGSKEDCFNFTFKSSDPSIVSIEYSGNTCVLLAKKYGISVITCENPASLYSSSMLVIVPKKDNKFFYLTTSENTVDIFKNECFELDIGIVGGDEGEWASISYNIKEGNDNITIEKNNGKFTVTGLEKGLSLINFYHPKASIPLEVKVIVNEKTNELKIESDKDFIVLDNFERQPVKFYINGENRGEWSYNVNEYNIIDVIQIQNEFLIKAVKEGEVSLKVYNSLTEDFFEVYILCEKLSEKDSTCYLKTYNNVLRLEKGDKDIVLDVKLINGNDQDLNSLKWTVSDSSVINVYTNNGKVSYERSAGGEECTINGKCYIDAVGTGHAQIKIKHDKSQNECILDVFVYEEGTLDKQFFEIKGNNFIKVCENQNTTFEYEIINGIKDKDFEIYVSDDSLFTVQENNGKIIINGLKKGNGYFSLSSDNLKNKVRVNVNVCSEEDLKKPYIFLDFFSIYEISGNSIFFDVKSSDGKLNALEITGYDESVMKVNKLFNNVNINFIKNAEGLLKIKGEGYDNEIVIPYKILDENIVSNPYKIKGPDFIKIKKNENKKLEIFLENALINDRQYFNADYDEEYVNIYRENNDLYVNAVKSGYTFITIEHPKANDRLNIPVFILEENQDEQKNIFYTKNNKITGKRNEKYFIELFSSDKNENFQNININVSDSSILNVNNENNFFVIDFKNEGSTFITISKEGYIDLIINVVCTDVMEGNNKNILYFPSIYKCIVNMNNSITVKMDGIYSNYIYDCDFILPKNFDYKTNLNTLRFNCNTAGIYEVYLKIDKLNINKKCIVYVYENENKLLSDNVIYTDSDSYEIYEGNTIEIKAESSSIIDTLRLSNITWKVISGMQYIDITCINDKCYVKGLSEGKSTVQVSLGTSVYTFSIKVKNNFNNDNIFECEDIIYLKKNQGGGFYININEGSYSDINVKTDSEQITASITNNFISLYSETPGNYFIYVSKPGFVTRKVLVKVYENILPAEEYFYLSDNYINIDKGQEKAVTVYSNITDSSFSINSIDLSYLNYRIEDNKIIFTSIKSGETAVNVSCKEFNEKIDVNIIDYNFTDENVQIKVQPIVFIKKGEEGSVNVKCNTSFTVNYEKGYERQLTFEIENNNVKINALEKGEYELNVYVNEENYKTIKIIVYENEEELNEYKTFNIEKRIYKTYQNENFTIIPCLYKCNAGDIKVENNSAGISVLKKSGFFEIKGNKEGVYNLIFSLNNQKIKIKIYVLHKTENEYIQNENDINEGSFYITGEVPYLKIRKGDTKTVNVNIQNIKDSFNENELIWSVNDSSVVSFSSFGRYGTFTALKEGQCTVSVSAFDSMNVYSFIIDVRENFYDDEKGYLYVEKRNIYLDITDTGYTFEIIPKNLDENILEDIDITYENNDVIEINPIMDKNRMFINVKPLKIGISYINLQLINQNINTKLSVVVEQNNKGSTPYLTSVNNYSVIKPGSIEKISVDLVNYEEIDYTAFRWNIVNGSENISIIGSGKEVQIYGNKEGISQIKVIHTPTSSSIDLYVNVTNSNQDIKYISKTKTLVETNVSNIMDFFTVSLVGGKERDNEKFTASVDKKDVLSVLMNNNVIYYRGLKEGECEVTVKNSESQNDLKIRFIVKNNNISSNISLSETSLYLDKDGSSKTVTAAFNGSENFDEGLLDWFIYNESTENVVNIVSSGSRCVIIPKNKGYAQIRCLYEPLGLYSNIGIYVGEDLQFSFKENNITLKENDSKFVEVTVPSVLSNIADQISFTSLDPSVVKVYGTSRVCLIEGIKKGQTVVRCTNNFDGSICEIGVNVTDKMTDEYYLALQKNTYLLNPRSADQRLNAYLFGKDVTDADQDEIKWEITSDETECLSLYPDKGREVFLKLNVCTVQGDEYFGRIKPGKCIIKVWHEKCMDDYKTIYVEINEEDNYFTLEKYSINIGTSQVGEIKSNIMNGSLKDYDDVIWTVSGFNTDKYGNKVDVARLLSTRGRSVSVYGLNEGVCTVSAFYFGNVVQCEVNVTSDRMFRINGPTSLKMFPDVNDENYLEVSYILRPSQNVPMWAVENIDHANDVSVISIEEVAGQQKVRIKPNGIEGKCKITGFAVGIGQVSVNVEVKFEPEIRLLENENKCVIKMTDEGSNDAYFTFYSYPKMYYPGISVTGQYASYVNVVLEDTVDKGDYLEGKIHVKVNKEFPMGGCTAVLQQYKDSSLTQSVNSQNSKVSFSIYGYYPDSGFSVGFKRGRGSYSLFDTSLSAGKEYDVDDKFIESENNAKYYKIYDSNSNNVPMTIDLADGEQHYFVIKSIHEGSFMENISVTVEEGSGGKKINENNKSLNYSRSEKFKQSALEINSIVQSKMTSNIPKVSSIERKSDGSYVFDITTGKYNDKYGVNWNIDEAAKSGESPVNASTIYSSKGILNEPELSYKYSSDLIYKSYFSNLQFNDYTCDYYDLSYTSIDGVDFKLILSLSEKEKGIKYETDPKIMTLEGNQRDNLSKPIFTNGKLDKDKVNGMVNQWLGNYYTRSDFISKFKIYSNNLKFLGTSYSGNADYYHMFKPVSEYTIPGNATIFDDRIYSAYYDGHNWKDVYWYYFPDEDYIFDIINYYFYDYDKEKILLIVEYQDIDDYWGENRYRIMYIDNYFDGTDKSKHNKNIDVYKEDGKPDKYYSFFKYDTNNWWNDFWKGKYYFDFTSALLLMDDAVFADYNKSSLHCFTSGNGDSGSYLNCAARRMLKCPENFIIPDNIKKSIPILTSSIFDGNNFNLFKINDDDIIPIKAGALYGKSIYSRITENIFYFNYDKRKYIDFNLNNFKGKFFDNFNKLFGSINNSDLNHLKNKIFYYDNTEESSEYDFKMNNLYLVIRWTDLSRQEQEIRIPVEVRYYNSTSDWYIYDESGNKIIGTRGNVINEYITNVK